MLIADEPTRGWTCPPAADHELLTTLTADGLGILLISSDVEILGLANGVLVMRGGRVVTELTGENVTRRRSSAPPSARSTVKRGT